MEKWAKALPGCAPQDFKKTHGSISPLQFDGRMEAKGTKRHEPIPQRIAAHASVPNQSGKQRSQDQLPRRRNRQPTCQAGSNTSRPTHSYLRHALRNVGGGTWPHTSAQCFSSIVSRVLALIPFKCALPSLDIARNDKAIKRQSVRNLGIKVIIGLRGG